MYNTSVTLCLLHRLSHLRFLKKKVFSVVGASRPHNDADPHLLHCVGLVCAYVPCSMASDKPTPPTYAEQLTQLRTPLGAWLKNCVFEGAADDDAEIFLNVCNKRKITTTAELLLTPLDRKLFEENKLPARTWKSDGIQEYFVDWRERFGPDCAEAVAAGISPPAAVGAKRCPASSEEVGFAYCFEVGIRNRIWSAIVNFYGEDALALALTPPPPPTNDNTMYIPNVDAKDVNLNAGASGGGGSVYIPEICATGTVNIGMGAMVAIGPAAAAATARPHLINTHTPGVASVAGAVDAKSDVSVNFHSSTGPTPTQVAYSDGIVTTGKVSLNINAPPVMPLPCKCTAMQRVTCGHDFINAKDPEMAEMTAKWQMLASDDYKGLLGVWRADRNDWCEARVVTASDVPIGSVPTLAVTIEYRAEYRLANETLNLFNRATNRRVRLFA